MQNELQSSFAFLCRGVKYPSFEQANSLLVKVHALQEKAGDKTMQDLEGSHNLCLPIFPKDEAVSAISVIFRNGTSKILCPCLMRDRCGALAIADIQGTDDVTSQFDPLDDFGLPYCPYAT